MNYKKKYPKTVNDIYNWFITINKEKHPDMVKFFTEDILELTIQQSPWSMVNYFDSVGLVGTLHYNNVEEEFTIYVNGEIIDIHEDHQYTKDRKKGELTLINYLFEEQEKTL